MQTWALVLLSNTLIAGALAITAIVVMRLRRPAIAHALWLLALIKLITPPMWDVNIPMPQWAIQPAEQVVMAPLPAEPTFTPPSAPIPSAGIPGEDPDEGVVGSVVTPIVAEPSPSPLPAYQERGSKWEPPSMTTVLGSVWVAGSALWLILMVVRIHRFTRFTRTTTAASPEIQQRANLLARALDMPASPPVELVPASISPMLWHDIRSTRLLVPQQLLQTLDLDQRDALLLHELAHLKRKDHLTRLLEIVVTAIFWWHPLVWIARRGLREAEEQCCDAWVIWAMPENARRYADALVDTLDFLAASPLSLPPGASGLGGLQSLQRRLTMIFTNTPPRAMSAIGRISVLGLLALLPMRPVWSQQPAQADPVPVEPVAIQPAVPTERVPVAAVDRIPTTGPAVRVDVPVQAPVAEPRRTAVNARRGGGLPAMTLSDIVRTADQFTAYIDAGRGGRVALRVGDKIAGGEVTRISLDEVAFLPAGATAPITVKVGSNLPVMAGPEGALADSAPLSGLTVEEQLRVRRAQELGQDIAIPPAPAATGRGGRRVAVGAPPVAAVAPQAAEMHILTGIVKSGDSLLAVLENTTNGAVRLTSVPSRIAGGDIVEIRADSIGFKRQGSNEITQVAIGSDLLGVPVARAGQPRAVDAALSIEERMRLRRDQERATRQAQAALAIQNPIAVPADPNAAPLDVPVVLNPALNLPDPRQAQVEVQQAQLEVQRAQVAVQQGNWAVAQNWVGAQPAAPGAPAAPAAPPDRAVVLALLEAMADQEQFVQQNAQQALMRMGPEALPIYIEAASSPNAPTRVGALKAMKDLLERYSVYRPQGRGGRGGQNFPTVMNPAGGGGGGRGGRGGGGFTGGGPPLPQTASPQAMELQAKVAPVAVKALRDTDSEARGFGAYILVLLIDQPDIAVPAMAGLLDSEELVLRGTALMGLSNVVRYRGPDRVTQHLPAIVKRLDDPSMELRVVSINLLGQCGPAAQAAVPELLKGIKDADASVRAAAATALGQIQAPPSQQRYIQVDQAVPAPPVDGF